MKDDEEIKDGQSVRVPIMLMDAVQKGVTLDGRGRPKLSLADYASLRKDYGGPPNQADPVPYDIANPGKPKPHVHAMKKRGEAAYAQMKKNLAGAWRTKAVA